MLDKVCWDQKRNIRRFAVILQAFLICVSGCGTAVQGNDVADVNLVGEDSTVLDAAEYDIQTIFIDSDAGPSDTDALSDASLCRPEGGALYCGNDRCNACTAPANAIPYCDGRSCGTEVRCVLGFGNCDRLAETGCEANLLSDPMHCGGCNRPCPAPAHATAMCAPVSMCSFICEPGYMRSGNECILPPLRLLRPLSSSVIVGNRPSFRWATLEGAQGYRFQLCTARACAPGDVVETADVGVATTYTLQNYRLNSRIHFWRVQMLVGGAVQRSSATWEFRSINTANGVEYRQRYQTLLDLNGDGREEILSPDTINIRGADQLSISAFGAMAAPMNGARLASLDWPAPIPASVSIVRTGDNNGDGLSDCGVLGADGLVLASRALLLTGEGDLNQMMQHVRVIDGSVRISHWVGDINDDGYQDVIGRQADGPRIRYVLLFGGASGLILPVNPLTDWFDEAVRSGPVRVLDDYDGDGRPEIYWAGPGGRAFIRNWSGTAFAAAAFADLVEPTQVPGAYAVGDINGDGLVDGTQNDTVYLAAPNGTTARTLTVMHQVGPASTMGIYPIGDINGDGIDDAAALGWAASEWWLDVLLGSRVDLEVQRPEFTLRLFFPLTIVAGQFTVGHGVSTLDFRGDGGSYLAIGGIPIPALSIYRLTPIAPAGNPPMAELIYRGSLSDHGLGSGLVLAPSTLLPAGNRQPPALFPASRFLAPTLRPHRLLRFLLSAHSTIGHPMGDYS